MGRHCHLCTSIQGTTHQHHIAVPYFYPRTNWENISPFQGSVPSSTCPLKSRRLLAKNDDKCAPSSHVDVHMTSAVEGQTVDQDVKCIIDCEDVSKLIGKCILLVDTEMQHVADGILISTEIEKYEERKLYGVFEATSDGAMDIVPMAFSSSGKLFSAQRGKKGGFRQLEGYKIYLGGFIVSSTWSKYFNGLHKLTQLDLWQTLKILIIIEEFEVPDHPDLILKERGPAIPMMEKNHSDKNRLENGYHKLIFDGPKIGTINLIILRNDSNEGGRSRRMKKRI
ncbi:hypothetical protein Taro_043421 [Colocasia esculenta]|uniref:DCD domain-containing protein n=1 Tax=Colocasia esculenta TaxID=4460 RepID=A0A843WS27_COLES|nr:hypothetical protein [Colocasia esculenta]